MAFQLRFLEEIQSILSRGRTASTYKFALLHAIADVCVTSELSRDDAAHELDLNAVARRFVALYQRQVRPFFTVDGEVQLKHDTSRRPDQESRVPRMVRERATAYRGAFEPDAQLVTETRRAILQMPLRRLQVVGNDLRELLYRHDTIDGRRATVRLQPGVAYCFRRFYDLVIALVRDHWTRAIHRLNHDQLDVVTDLQDFLFGSERNDLTQVRRSLVAAQDGAARCFYTAKRLHRATPSVDHFIPWSVYPVDLGHNFVLTTTTTNCQKSDQLAHPDYLEQWLDHITADDEALTSQFQANHVTHDREASIAIATWAYSTAAQRGQTTWHKSGTTVALNSTDIASVFSRYLGRCR